MPPRLAIAPHADDALTEQAGTRQSMRQRSRTLPATRYEKWSLQLAVASIVGFSLLVGIVGADARWLAALGHDVVSSGHIPRGLPFAAAPTSQWHNVTVLAELVFWALEAALGDRGLVVAQAVAVGIAFGVLAWAALQAGAGRQQTASTCLLAAVGVLPSLAIVRVQLFSLALFPVLLVLLRSDSRARSHRVWLLPPLLALWSNLHGAVLVGLAVTLAYLALSRLRESPLETLMVGVLCVSALCMNPAGIHALSYYHGVLDNAAAQLGEGMWGPLSPASPFDDLLIIAAIALAVRAARARLSGWEIVVLMLLAAMTIHAARSGIWLLLMLVSPAAIGARPGSPWRRRVVLLAAASLAAFAVAAVRGPTPTGADHRVIAQAIDLAKGTPILANDIAAEQIALAGGKVWASDPIDAFQRRVQVAYLHWMDGQPGGLAAVDPAIRIVVVSRGTGEAALMQKASRFRVIARTRGFELFTRVTRTPTR